MRADIHIDGEGMYQIGAETPVGQAFINDLVEGAEHGLAYSDRTDLAMDIADGAREHGLVVAINGREYLGGNKVAQGPPLDLT